MLTKTHTILLKKPHLIDIASKIALKTPFPFSEFSATEKVRISLYGKGLGSASSKLLHEQVSAKAQKNRKSRPNNNNNKYKALHHHNSERHFRVPNLKLLPHADS